MRKYGADKTRIRPLGMELEDVTDIVRGSRLRFATAPPWSRP